MSSVDWVARSRALNLQVCNFIDGRWQGEGRGDALEKFGPRDGQQLCRFAGSDAREVDAAVAAARRAFDDGRWAKLPQRSRKDALYKLATLIEGQRDTLALLECLDVGKPISDALSVDIPMAVEAIRCSAEAADKVYGRVYGVDEGSLSYQLYRPIGVAAGITGWNFPLVLAANKIGPALAAGDSLVLKPSELTSLSAARIAELALEAGVPEGVLNVIHGCGGVGASLAEHPDVDLVTFTGSSATGKKLMIAAGKSNMKRLILECGGKAPNIVFDDSPDLEAVADAVVARAFWNQGEVCTASSRLLVHQGIKNDLLPLIIQRAATLTPGDPLNSDTRFGAVVSQGHQQKILNYIESAKRERTRIAFQCRSKAPFDGGFYVSPIIFDGVKPEQKIAREEIFGPVLSVLSFADEAEAVRLANDTVYGLSAILWTKDIGRAHRVIQGIRAGWIVAHATGKPKGGPGGGVMSIGGLKQSGMGTEGGVEGLEAYMSKTAVQIFV